MEPLRLLQVDVGQGVPADHQQDVVPQGKAGGEGVTHPACRPQRLLLFVKRERYPSVLFAEMRGDGVGQIPQRHRRLPHAAVLQQIQNIGHHRTATQSRHGLWLIAGQRTQPFALSSCHDHCFHILTRPFRAEIRRLFSALVLTCLSRFILRALNFLRFLYGFLWCLKMFPICRSTRHLPGETGL